MEQIIWAIVKFQFEGIHHYPEADGEESFLRHPHRHVFHVDMWIEQRHDNRELEYLNFKKKLREEFDNKVGNMNHKSCEMMAKDIADYIWQMDNGAWKDRALKITVTEDGENGACIMR